MSLKLKVSDLESELLEERQQKQMKQEFTIETLKGQVQEQYYEQKLRYEEQIMREKENGFKMKVELQGLQERNQILKEQLAVFRTRISELEKENIVQSKENYILNSELDYEGHRAAQLQRQSDKFLAGVAVNRATE